MSGEKAEFLVDILEDNGNKLRVRGFLQDESPFELWVDKYDIKKMQKSEDPKKHPFRGWLTVDYFGESNRIASIQLPKPTMNLGHRVSVSTSHLRRFSSPKK